MDRMSCNFRARGLTLIELMIALVILAVTVTVAAPAMQQLIQGSRLRAETTRLLDAINLARSEAVGRNIPVSVCPSSMALSGVPSCVGDYGDGWIVFTNRDRNPEVDPGVDEIIQAFEPVPEGYSLTNKQGNREVSDLITYLPDGSSRKNLSLHVCPPPGAGVLPITVVLNSVGRARADSGAAPCPRDKN